MYNSLELGPNILPITLHEAVVCKALQSNLSFSEYKLLAEWLECYNYVLPAKRSLESKFVALWVDKDTFNSSLGVYKLWMICNIIESCLPSINQLRILSWMNQ